MSGEQKRRVTRAAAAVCLLLAAPGVVRSGVVPNEWDESMIKEGLSGAAAVTTADMNHDGCCDVVVAARDGSDRVVWYRQPCLVSQPDPADRVWPEYTIDPRADGASAVAAGYLVPDIGVARGPDVVSIFPLP